MLTLATKRRAVGKTRLGASERWACKAIGCYRYDHEEQ